MDEGTFSLGSALEKAADFRAKPAALVAGVKNTA